MLKGISLTSEITKGPGFENYSCSVTAKELNESSDLESLLHSLHGTEWVCLIITHFVSSPTPIQNKTKQNKQRLRQDSVQAVYWTGGLWELEKEKRPYFKKSLRLWAKHTI